MINLKEKLLQLNIFEDNIYLDKYINLIKFNKDTKAEKFKTQKHHIIPKYYYKYNNLNIDNSKENLVNLLYRDHILAHYYLALCSIDDKMKYANECAINHIQGIKYFNDKNFINSLEYYQQLYEHSRECVSKNMSGRKPPNFGKICINKDYHNTYIKKDELQYYLDLGYQIGNAPLSDAAKQSYKQMGINNKGKSRPNMRNMFINNDLVNKRVYKEDLEHYINLGWKTGKIEYKKNIKRDHTKGTIIITNGILDKHIKKEDLDLYLNDGWMLGSKIKNRICINNTEVNKYINKENLDLWLDTGWKVGPKRRK